MARQTQAGAPRGRRRREKARALRYGTGALLLEFLLATPWVERLTEQNGIIHDTQHGLIFCGGLLMGLALRDALVHRGSTEIEASSALAPLIAAALALAAQIILISPWSDHLADTHPLAHYAVHGLMFTGGAVAAFSVKTALLKRPASQARDRARSA